MGWQHPPHFPLIHHEDVHHKRVYWGRNVLFNNVPADVNLTENRRGSITPPVTPFFYQFIEFFGGV